MGGRPLLLGLSVMVRVGVGFLGESGRGGGDIPSWMQGGKGGGNQVVGMIVKTALDSFPKSAFFIRLVFQIMADMWVVWYGFLVGLACCRIGGVLGVAEKIQDVLGSRSEL